MNNWEDHLLLSDKPLAYLPFIHSDYICSKNGTGVGHEPGKVTSLWAYGSDLGVARKHIGQLITERPDIDKCIKEYVYEHELSE